MRLKKGLTATSITADLRKRLASLEGAFIIVIPPPAVPGIGTGGGFTMRIQDRQGRGPELLAAATDELVAAARKAPGLTSVFSPFTANTPQVFVDIDRIKAQKLGVPIQNVTEAIETYFGSAYVNDFNILGRTYHVTAQADLPFRKETADLARLRTRNAAGDMVLLGSVVNFRDISGPDRVARYNLYPASELQGDTTPGTSSATAIDTMKRLAAQTLPSGFSYEWTDLSYQQVTGGNSGLYVFPICVLFVFLVLSAQYGSWSLPFAVILIVPMCLLAATIGVRIMGQDVNILTQIGFVVLVGLAAKNAILIVEFARDIELEGRGRLEAVIEACRLRLRPILMTSFAFILGVLPLVISTGSGSEMRQAVGVAVFFGMLGRDLVRADLHADLLHDCPQSGGLPRTAKFRLRRDNGSDRRFCTAAPSTLSAYFMGSHGAIKYHRWNRNVREALMKSGLLSAAVAACGLLLAGPVSAQGVKIGILNDQSGVYADYGGKWSFEAAKMAAEDFGGSVLGQKIEMISADHQNKPDLATAIARRWYEVEGVDMITELTTSSVALAIHDLSKQMKKIDIVVGAATSRLTGDACHALRLPLGLRYACARGRYRRRAGRSRRRYLVLHDRRLRLRLCARKGHRRSRQGKGWQGPWLGPHSPELVGFLVIPAAGAKLEGEDHRARQCRARHHQLHQAGGGIRHRQGRPEARRPVADAG